MLILYFKVSNSHFFKKANITKILKKYKNIYKDYYIFFVEKIYYLFLYCKIFTTKYVKFMISFLLSN